MPDFRITCDEKVVTVPPPQPATVEAVMQLSAKLFSMPTDTYDLYDKYGKIELAEDLQRAIQMAGGENCDLTVKEHSHFRRLRGLEDCTSQIAERASGIEASIKVQRDELLTAITSAKQEVEKTVEELSQKLESDVRPVLEALVRDKAAMQKEVNYILETLAQLDLEELREIAASTNSIKSEVGAVNARVSAIEASKDTDKVALTALCNRGQQDLHELQRYLQGKVDVCIEADADLRREQQAVAQRMQIVADDLRLLTEDTSRLTQACSGSLQDSEELRTLIGRVREDNAHLKSDHGLVKTRVHCLEGEKYNDAWDGKCWLSSDVLYFKQFHRQAKGPDVQLCPSQERATGRGFLASTGMVIGNFEGLAVADGPCRRFGTPGCYSSYFEIEVEETKIVPPGVGGLYVGMSLQSAEEIRDHPGLEFDGWMVGGPGKAMVYRAGTLSEAAPDPDKLPSTFGRSPKSDSVLKAAKLLRKAMPPRPAGDMREFSSSWNSQDLKVGDRIGVLFRCNRNGGAHLRIAVNGFPVCMQAFEDAPCAEAVGYFTPVVRLAGAGKSVRMLPGVTPPSRILGD